MASGRQWLGIGWAPRNGGGGGPPPFQCIPGPRPSPPPKSSSTGMPDSSSSRPSDRLPLGGRRWASVKARGERRVLFRAAQPRSQIQQGRWGLPGSSPTWDTTRCWGGRHPWSHCTVLASTTAAFFFFFPPKPGGLRAHGWHHWPPPFYRSILVVTAHAALPTGGYLPTANGGRPRVSGQQRSGMERRVRSGLPASHHPCKIATKCSEARICHPAIQSAPAA